MTENELQRALRAVEHVTDSSDQWAQARQLIAKERRDAGIRTWNDSASRQPDDVDEVFDLDSDVWVRGPAPRLNGAWKMRDFDPDEHETAAGGWYVWSALIEKYGPISASQDRKG